MNDLIKALRAFAGERDWERYHSPKNLAMALSVEAAEIVEKFQWLSQDQSRALDAGKLAELEEEIGDVMIYLTMLADKYGLDPLVAARKKMEINRAKYPAEQVRGKSDKYTEYE